MYVWSQENDSFPEMSMLPSFLDTRSVGRSNLDLRKYSSLVLLVRNRFHFSRLLFIIPNNIFTLFHFFLLFESEKIIYNLSGSIVLHQYRKKDSNLLLMGEKLSGWSTESVLFIKNQLALIWSNLVPSRRCPIL